MPTHRIPSSVYHGLLGLPHPEGNGYAVHPAYVDQLPAAHDSYGGVV